jgi:Domain of unknown function (DUF6894)
MPLFFFDYYDKDERDLDTDGIEFPDMEAAYLDAYHSAMDMWAEARHEGRDVSHHRFEIRDATGNIVVVLPFTEVLKGG